MDIVDVLKRYGAALNADEEEHIPIVTKDECSASTQKTSPSEQVTIPIGRYLRRARHASVSILHASSFVFLYIYLVS